jgi:hypothetical protein
MREQEERPMTDAEAAALNHMLSRDFPGVEQLRAQARTALVARRCTCGCPSIDLSVAQNTKSSEEEAISRMIASAASTDPRCTHLLLWVNDHADGRRVLSGVELAWLDGPPEEFSPADAFGPPEPEASYFRDIEGE